VSILRSRSLGGLIAAEVISSLGSRMTYLALPWFVLVTTGSATKMGIVLGAEIAPVAVLGIPSGALVTRLGARRSMLVCDLARAPLIAAVPAFHAAGALSFPLLVGLVTLVGCFHAPYFASQRVILPELVGEDEQRIAQANAFVEGGNRLTGLAGPAVAGVLIAATGVTNVVYLDAATYVASFVLVKVLVPQRPRLAVAEEEAGGVLAGLRFLLADRVLGPLIATATVSNVAGPALTASLSALAFEEYGRSARIAGLLFASIGGGALVGVAATLALLERMPPLRLAAFAFVLGSLPLWLLPLHLPVVVLAAALAAFGAATMLVNAPVLGLLTARTPDALRAKVITAVITVATLAGPLGAVVAGPLIESIGVRSVLGLVAGVMTTSALLFASVALVRGRELDVQLPPASAPR
jgi:MFS family permease